MRKDKPAPEIVERNGPSPLAEVYDSPEFKAELAATRHYEALIICLAKAYLDARGPDRVKDALRDLRAAVRKLREVERS